MEVDLSHLMSLTFQRDYAPGLRALYSEVGTGFRICWSNLESPGERLRMPYC